jgi:hypothetical protein
MRPRLRGAFPSALGARAAFAARAAGSLPARRHFIGLESKSEPARRKDAATPDTTGSCEILTLKR